MIIIILTTNISNVTSKDVLIRMENEEKAAENLAKEPIVEQAPETPLEFQGKRREIRETSVIS